VKWLILKRGTQNGRGSVPKVTHVIGLDRLGPHSRSTFPGHRSWLVATTDHNLRSKVS